MTLLKRSMIKILLPSAIIVLVSLVLVREISYKSTMQETQQLLDNKIQNYSGKIATELNSIRNVLQALGAVFYNGMFQNEQDDLDVFINFTNLYPKSTGFYGELNDHYYDGTLWVPDSDWVAKERPWYHAAQKGGGKVVFSDLYTDAQTGLAVTSVSQEIRTRDNITLGVIALDYPLDSVAKTVDELLKDKKEEIFILTDSGNFAVSKRYTAEDNIKSVDNGTYSTIASKLLSGEGSFEKTQLKGIPYYFNSTKIADTGWILVIGESVSSVMSFSRQMSILLLSSLIVLVLAILIITALTMIHISNPLKMTAAGLSKIATGSADLTKRLEIPTTSDEMVLIKDSFNAFVAHLQSIITEIRDTKTNLIEYGKSLGDLVQDNTDYVTKMVSNISSVDDEVNNQHEKVSATTASGTQISNAVVTLGEQLSNQKSSVNEASSVVTNMVESVNNVAANIAKMADQFTDLKKGVTNGIEGSSQVSKKISEIEEQSKILSDANVTISSIAEQTNLLAMNAAIEASHAGKAGQGFAVVAGEIRKLSENSATQSKRINDQLTAIIDAINNAVDKSSQSDKIFSDAYKKINATGDLVAQIKEQMLLQSSSSNQISGALNNMLEASKNVEDSSVTVDNARKDITKNVSLLKDSSDIVHKSVVDMTTGVDHIKSDNDKLFAITTAINDSLYRITKQIDLFEL